MKTILDPKAQMALLQQAQHIDQEKRTAVGLLIALLREHHNGKVSLTQAMAQESIQGAYSLEIINNGPLGTITIKGKDEKGNSLEVIEQLLDIPQGSIEDTIANEVALRMIETQRETVESVITEEITRCPECNREFGHNMDCSHHGYDKDIA